MSYAATREFCIKSASGIVLKILNPLAPSSKFLRSGSVCILSISSITGKPLLVYFFFCIKVISALRKSPALITSPFAFVARTVPMTCIIASGFSSPAKSGTTFLSSALNSSTSLAFSFKAGSCRNASSEV